MSNRTHSDQFVVEFLTQCSNRLTRSAADGPDDEHRRGAEALRDALARSTPETFEPGWLSVLDETIDLVGGDELTETFVELAPTLPWTPTRRATDGGTDFALSPLNQVRDFGTAMVGIMYVRPHSQYPLHHHPPQELYLTISGQADWRYGGHDDFRPVGPGRMLYNHPNDLHSAIAGPTPLVALYVLWP